MNTTLPPSRDLPAGRHAEIRGAVLAAATSGRAHRRLAPLAAAAAAVLAVVGLVAWFTPWAAEPAAPPVAASDGAAAIEKFCGWDNVTLTLKQVLTDEVGQVALLHDVDERQAIICPLDVYRGGGGEMGEFTPPLTVDVWSAFRGGDAPGSRPEYAGRRGTEDFAGRVAPEVVSVTVTVGADSVDASVANGTFLARLLRPADWSVPKNRQVPVVRAYDKNGTLLAEMSPQPR